MQIKAYAAKTHQGPYFALNEDLFKISLEKNIFGVFDGFGGSGRGDKVAEIASENLFSFYTKFSMDPDSTLPFFFSPKYSLEGNALVNAMHYAHKKVNEFNNERPINQRGGACSIIACLADNLMTLALLGNCSAYLVRKGQVHKIIKEDDFRLLGQDNYACEFRTIPQTAFGLYKDLYYSIQELRPVKGDQVFLLTDGCFARLSSVEIEDQLRSSSENLSDKINSIFDFANNRGNIDNLSAVILKF